MALVVFGPWTRRIGDLFDEREHQLTVGICPSGVPISGRSSAGLSQAGPSHTPLAKVNLLFVYHPGTGGMAYCSKQTPIISPPTLLSSSSTVFPCLSRSTPYHPLFLGTGHHLIIPPGKMGFLPTRPIPVIFHIL